MSKRQKRLKSQIFSAAEWLGAGNSVTSVSAFKMWKTTRLSSIIHDLRGYGAKIETELVESGNGAKFARYRVREEDLPSLTKALRHVQAPETVIKERC